MLPALAGDCIEIYFESNIPRMIIIDGGMGKECRAILKKDVNKWKSENGPVDLAILTHMDNDHINGFLSLVKEDNFDEKSLSEMWFNYGEQIEEVDYEVKNRLYIADESCLTSCKQGKELHELLKNKNITLVAPIISGTKKVFDECYIEVISPSSEGLKKYVSSKEYQSFRNDLSDLQTAARKNDYDHSIEDLLDSVFDEASVTNANASSIAVLINEKGHKILCLGDAKASEVEKELRKRGYSEETPLTIDFLKVSHHGSSHNTSDSLIRILDCSNYLISTNWKGLPTKECLARIIGNSKKAVTFYCNYEPDITIFTEEEYQKYGMKFRNIRNMEMEVSGESI